MPERPPPTAEGRKTVSEEAGRVIFPWYLPAFFLEIHPHFP